MSQERFDWLAGIAGRVIKTPGTESNVKEIFDTCWELRRSGQEIAIFNQFEDPGNYLWHHAVTGPAMERVLERVLGPRGRFHGVVLATGSAGTIASGDYLKRKFPGSRIAAVEATQCPTMLRNGYGSHRIEGIGDKHIPWIHNVRNTDVVIGIDDAGPLALIRLFNEPAGRGYLGGRGLTPAAIGALPLVGISGACNLLAAIKLAKLHGTGPDDVILTVLTDSIDLYRSRLRELEQADGPLTESGAAAIHQRYLLGAATDEMLDLTTDERRRIHNLKYFTWVEQQGRTVEELDRQWSDPGYWSAIGDQAEALDDLIDEFNGRVAAA
jgi:cysteine synthase